MSNKPFFSVIIPTFNRKLFVQKAIQSVLDQTHSDWEFIIVDDGSTDGTVKMLKKYFDRRIKIIDQANHGVSNARNRAISVANAEWVCFLDSDDSWLPEKLARVRKTIKENPDILFFHTQESWFRDGKEVYQRKKYCRPSGKVYRDVVMICCIGASTAVIKKDVFEKVGYFDEEFPVCEDYDFWLRVTHQFEIKLIDEALTVKEGGREDQLSAQRGLDQYRIESLIKMLNDAALDIKDYDATVDALAFKSEIFLSGAIKHNRLTKVWQHQDLFNGLMKS